MCARLAAWHASKGWCTLGLLWAMQYVLLRQLIHLLRAPADLLSTRLAWLGWLVSFVTLAWAVAFV